MGNMSNPCINRWGLNTFWYRFWYSDNYYTFNLQQDRIFVKLLYIYFNYGIELPKSIFFNTYWYQKNLKPSTTLSYYRFSTFKNSTLGLNSTYRFRYSITDVYPMKLWLLKYNNWIIINFYWFQPLKKKITRKSYARSRTRDMFRVTPTADQFDALSLRRTKALVNLSLSGAYFAKTYYKF